MKAKATGKTKAAKTKSSKISIGKQGGRRSSYLASLIDNISDALISADMDFHIMEWNLAAESMYGWTAVEVMGHTAGEFIRTEYSEEVTREDVIQAVIQQGNWKGEATQNHKDGTRFPVMISISLVKDETDKPTGFVTINRDISSRKQVEAKVEQQNQRLKILREIDVAILAADSVESIVGAALSHIRELIGCRRASLTLFDWDKQEASLFDVKTAGATSNPTGMQVPIAPYQEMIQIFLKNEPLVINDLSMVTDAPPALQRTIQAGFRSLCSQPLFSQSSLIGTFGMASETPDYFDQEKINLSREVANQVAIAITQSRLTERLRESEEKYRAFFENSLDAILLTMPDGTIQAANPAACKMFGRTETEICALGRSGLVDSNDPRLAVLLEERARTGKAFGELTMLRHDGTPFPVEMSSALFQDRQGNTRTSMIIRDITERRQSENDLRVSEQKFSILFKSAPFAAQLARLPAGDIVEVNQEFEKLVGYSRAELIGKTSLELNMYPDPETRARMVAEFQAQGFTRNAELAFRTKSGDLRHLLVSTDFIEVGREKHVLTTAQDITERKRAEAALRVEVERFQRFVESNIVGIVIANAAGKIITTNDYYLKILDVTRQDFEAGKVDWRKFTPPEWLPADEKAIQELRERGVCEPYEKEYVRADGTRVPVYLANAMLPGPEEQIAAFVLDITERKQAEQRLRESEEKYSVLFEKSAVPAALLRLPEVVIVDVNEAFEKLTGFTKQEFTGKTAVELGLGKQKERARMITQFEEQGTLNDNETSLITKSGEERIIVANTNPLLLNGQPYALTTAQDITERKHAEKELRISEERFSKAFFASPAGLTITRIADGKFIDVNEAFLRMSEFSRAEVIGHTSTELNILSPEERAKLIQAQLESGGLRNAELQAQAKSGRIVNILFSSKPMELGGEACHVTTMIDITERKRAEEQIQRQLQRLNGLRNIDIAISSSFDMRVILDIVLQQVVSLLNVDAAAILLIDPQMQTMEYAEGVGFHSHALRHTQLKLNEGYAGRAVVERKTIHTSDLMETRGNLTEALRLANEDFVDYYGTPLVVKGEVKGVLEIYHRSSMKPNQEWLDFFETLAGQTAIAVDNSQLFQNLQRANFELSAAYDATIEGWSRAMDLRDKETEGHTQRVTELALRLARELKVSEVELVHIRRGGLLHDMGKLGVPDHILLKPDKLTDAEWEIMRKHPQFAYDMLSGIGYVKSALEIPYCHHEKWDGTGYPRGLEREGIPLSARIFAVADVWDAITSDRPYRKGWSKANAVEYIKEQSGKHFDPQVVEVFLKIIDLEGPRTSSHHKTI